MGLSIVRRKLCPVANYGHHMIVPFVRGHIRIVEDPAIVEEEPVSIRIIRVWDVDSCRYRLNS